MWIKYRNESNQTVCIIGVLILSTKLCKADGHFSISEKEEILGINTFIKNQEHNFAVSVSTIRKFLGGKNNKVTPAITERKKRRTEKIDYDKDGTADGERIDYNGNGKWDCIALDKNKDGRFEEWWHDKNENDIFDLYIREEYKEDGELYYLWIYDTNEDGIFDGNNDCYREDNDLDLRAEETGCN